MNKFFSSKMKKLLLLSSLFLFTVVLSSALSTQVHAALQQCKDNLGGVACTYEDTTHECTGAGTATAKCDVKGGAAAGAGTDVEINIQRGAGDPGLDPGTKIGTIISNGISIIFVVATILVFFMLVIGGFQWITSGGDKENVAKARGRITHALIGLVIIAVAWVIMTTVGQLLNVNFTNLKLPALDKGTTTPAAPTTP